MTLLLISHDTAVSFGDALRIITVLEFLAVLGLTCAILAIYFIGNRHIRRVDTTHVGALPRYVVSMAISYALLVAFGIAEIQGFYGTVLTYRAPIGFIAANFGLYATVNLLLFENARLDVRDNLIRAGGTPDGGA